MKHSCVWVKIIGILAMALGFALLAPAAALFTQQFRFFRTNWGVFDIQVAGTPLSNTTAGVVLVSVGVPLLILGGALSFWCRSKGPRAARPNSDRVRLGPGSNRPQDDNF
jgi:hypothetical protein